MSGKYFTANEDAKGSSLQLIAEIDSEGDFWIGTNDDDSERVLLSLKDVKALGKFLLAEVERQEESRLEILEALVEPARALYTDYSIALKPGERNEGMRDTLAAAIKRANQ